METMNWESLMDASPAAFSPTPHYDPDSDSLSIFVSDDESFRERIDELLTVYRSFRTKEVVGCHVKHVRKILDTVHMFQLGIESRTITIGLILMGLRVTTEGDQAVVKNATYREIIRPIAEGVGGTEIEVPAYAS